MSLCDLQRSQLLVVDVQKRLVSAMDSKAVADLADNCIFLLQSAAIVGAPVLCSEQYPKGLGNTLANIAEHMPNSTVKIEKTCFSCTGAPEFASAIDESRDQIIIVGMESHVCILQTAMQLKEQGKEVFVVEDACISRSERNHKGAMDRMAQAGIVVTNCESVVFEWLRDTSHAGFKQVSTLLKERG